MGETRWRLLAFPGRELRSPYPLSVVLGTDDPEVVEVVERVAAEHGVVIERELSPTVHINVDLDEIHAQLAERLWPPVWTEGETSAAPRSCPICGSVGLACFMPEHIADAHPLT